MIILSSTLSSFELRIVKISDHALDHPCNLKVPLTNSLIFHDFGNKYYTNSKKKRWVIYKNLVESSKIPPEWHLWIHDLVQKAPLKSNKKFKWQKEYVENLTGTDRAHKPSGSLKSDSKKNMKKYETWKI